MYAVIDIENYGWKCEVERLTEIAVYIHDGTRIVEEYSTLINPERNILISSPPLPGSQMRWLKKSSRFFEVARRIVELTEGRTFVAHNARFDYSFIRQEFSMLGYNFRRPMLDTVALSRKLLPGHRSYSLGNLCSDLGIEINGRHRASGDALATVRLLELLLEKDRELKSGSRIRNRKAAILHPSLELSDWRRYLKMPESITSTMKTEISFMSARAGT
jgi:DNA polymerase-3 subunit epsilon